jgi:hypothetical protein
VACPINHPMALPCSALRAACAPLLLIAGLGLAQPLLANDHGGGGGGADLITLETITTNLAADADGSSRFVQLAITLRLDDPKGAAAINAYMPQVRNDILMLLAGQWRRAEDDQGPRRPGRGDPRHDQWHRRQPGLHRQARPRQPATGPVKTTLFTNFIIQ